MPEELNRLIEAARQRLWSYQAAERHFQDMQNRLMAEKKRRTQLEAELDKENEDVEKLVKLSWTSLFHTILRSKEEQLKLERQQALSTALKLQETEREIEDLERELTEVRAWLADHANAQRELDELMRRKEEWVRSSGSPDAMKLAEKDEALLDIKDRLKETDEALSAGRSLLYALEEAASALGKAKNWGTYDMLGGGMISTAIKHSHIDDAKDHIHDAQHLLARFKQELTDLNETADIRIDTGGMVKFGDYFFDGLIMDWAVQSRISGPLGQIEEQTDKVREAVTRLNSYRSTLEQAAVRLYEERKRLIGESGNLPFDMNS